MSVAARARLIAAGLDALESHRGFLEMSWRTWALAHPQDDLAGLFEAWAQATARLLAADTPALSHCPPGALWQGMIAAAQAGGLEATVAQGLLARVRAGFPDSL